jgi:hypothetical protein
MSNIFYIYSGDTQDIRILARVISDQLNAHAGPGRQRCRKEICLNAISKGLGYVDFDFLLRAGRTCRLDACPPFFTRIHGYAKQISGALNDSYNDYSSNFCTPALGIIEAALAEISINAVIDTETKLHYLYQQAPYTGRFSGLEFNKEQVAIKAATHYLPGLRIAQEMVSTLCFPRGILDENRFGAWEDKARQFLEAYLVYNLYLGRHKLSSTHQENFYTNLHSINRLAQDKHVPLIFRANLLNYLNTLPGSEGAATLCKDYIFSSRSMAYHDYVSSAIDALLDQESLSKKLRYCKT